MQTAPQRGVRVPRDVARTPTGRRATWTADPVVGQVLAPRKLPDEYFTKVERHEMEMKSRRAIGGRAVGDSKVGG